MKPINWKCVQTQVGSGAWMATLTVYGATQESDLLTIARELLGRVVQDPDRWLFNDVEHLADRSTVFYVRLTDGERDQVAKADEGDETETRVEETWVEIEPVLQAWGEPVPELDPPAIPLSQMTPEQREKWALREQAIRECVERFQASGSIADEALAAPRASAKLVLTRFAKGALVVLAALAIAALRCALHRRGIATLALLALLSGCGVTQARATQIGVELDAVLKRTQPDDRLDVNQRAKLYSDEATLKADVAALASGR